MEMIGALLCDKVSLESFDLRHATSLVELTIELMPK